VNCFLNIKVFLKLIIIVFVPVEKDHIFQDDDSLYYFKISDLDFKKEESNEKKIEDNKNSFLLLSLDEITEKIHEYSLLLNSINSSLK
jgi:hypothetical protein